MTFRSAIAVTGTVLLVTGCAPDVPESLQSNLGTSELAPSVAPEKNAAKASRKRDKAARGDGGTKAARPGSANTTAKRSDRQASSGPTAAATSPAAEPVRLTASVSDATGDVSSGLSGAPAHTDLTGATLTRDGSGFALRIAFADDVPTRSTDARTQNVASFYDLDGDGVIDYEVWATLADNGWSGSYRTPSGARFGDDSGVSARPRGRDLVISFPAAHLQGASKFRWAVGAEWGTPEQIASGTTARDNAPDNGVAPFPQ